MIFGSDYIFAQEFRCALIDYALSDINCTGTSSEVLAQRSRVCSNKSVVYIKMADFEQALAAVNVSLGEDETEINRASAYKLSSCWFCRCFSSFTQFVPMCCCFLCSNRAVALIHVSMDGFFFFQMFTHHLPAGTVS